MGCAPLAEDAASVPAAELKGNAGEYTNRGARPDPAGLPRPSARLPPLTEDEREETALCPPVPSCS